MKAATKTQENMDLSIINDVEKVVRLDGEIKKYNVSRLTKLGENYSSLILRVDFEIEKNGIAKTISTVAKRIPLEKSRKKFDFTAYSMLREIRWYSEILPLLEQFAREYGFRKDIFPKCLGSRYNLDLSQIEADESAILVLENLNCQDYQTANKFIGFDLETAKAVLQALAMFHALPIAMKKKEPEIYQKLKDTIDKGGLSNVKGLSSSDESKKSPFATSTSDGAEKFEDFLLRELKKYPNISPYLSRLEPIISNPNHPKRFLSKTEEPWNTITHNDFWVNNVMVKKRKNMEPLLKIVDFQLFFFGSYAKDVVFFLLTSVNNDVIKESIDELLSIYHEEFTSALRQTSTGLELSYGDFIKEINNVAVTSQICHAIFHCAIIYADHNEVVDNAVEDFDSHNELPDMMKQITPHLINKIEVIASIADKRGWI